MKPPRRSRLGVAAVIATIAAIFPLTEHLRAPGRPSDFGIVWFGARSLLHGVNPYPLVGPGRLYEWDWALLYPATAMVAAIPLSWLTETAAAVTFVWISTALFAWALTSDGWDRLYLFPSAAFIVAARSAQWSPLFSAAFLIPSMAWVFSAKPNIGAALALASSSVTTWRAAVFGGIGLILVSVALLPSWPVEWLAAIGGATHLTTPIARFGGPFIALALLRWRRPEALLILFLACVPQTGAWYEALPLLLVAQTRRESQILSMVSSIGFILIRFIVHGQAEALFNQQVSTLMVGFAYLPATIVVLRKPNDGDGPAWVTALGRLVTRSRAA